ncbi:MAG: hypothetical protein ACRCTB_12670 [Vibrio sp.]
MGHDHANAAKKANKPAVLEEYGIGRNEPQNRDFIYHKWTQTVYEQGLAGSMFWILTSLDSDQPDRLYPDYDGFRILNDGGSTATLLTNHSKQMRGLPYEQKNSVYLAYPVEGMKVSEATFTVRSYPMPITGNKVEQVQLRLPESDQLLEMTDNDGDGYYEVELKADDIGYGDKTLITIASFTQGERQTDRAKIEVDRPIIGYEVGTRYDFNDGTLQGWQKEGTWQTNWKNPALQIATDLGSILRCVTPCMFLSPQEIRVAFALTLHSVTVG